MKKGQKVLYILSDDVRVVAGLDFEAAIVCPHVDGCANTGDRSLIDLQLSALIVEGRL